MIVRCKNGSNTGANQQDNLLTEEDPCKFIDTFEWECWLYELYWLFPQVWVLYYCSVYRPLPQDLPTYLTPVSLWIQWSFRCGVVFLVYCLRSLGFLFGLWMTIIKNCATGCTVSDDVSWLSKYRGNSGEPTLLLLSSRGQMCK